MLRLGRSPTRGFIARSCAELAPTSSTIVSSPPSARSVSWPRPSLNDETNKFTNEQSNNNNNNNNIQNNSNSLLHQRQSSSFVVRSIASNDITPLCPALVTHPRFFATSSTPSSLAPNDDAKNNRTSNYLVDVKNAAFRLWFNEELIRHVIRKLQNSNYDDDDYNILTSTFTSLHQKFHDEAGQNYSSLLEEMNADNFNASNGLFLDKLNGAILDKVVLEHMISWQKNSHHIAASNNPLLLGTLCFLNALAKAKPQLLEPKIAVASVSETIPYKDFRILCREMSVDLIHKRVANEFTSLMHSTITKYNKFEERQKLSVAITERIKQRHDELKQHHAEIVRRFKEKQQAQTNKNNNNNNKERNSTASTTNATDSAQVVAQARLLESANCYLSCSWSGLATCSKRFTDSPVALRHQFVIDDYSAANDRNHTTPYFSDRVNIVAGPSGSGKTISSLLAAPRGIARFEVYNILLHVGIDCCVAADVSFERFDRDYETKRELLRGILRALVLRSSDEVAELLPDTYGAEKMWDRFCEVLELSVLRYTGDMDAVVRIVVDEIDKRPSFLRGLCSIWNQIRSKLADVFAISDNRLELFVVGSGTECFHMSPPGSFPVAYHIFAISRRKIIFNELFEYFQKNVVTKSSLVKELYNILVTDAAKQTDPIFKAIIRMSSNARCGAIILSFIEKTALNFQTLVKFDLDQIVWTFDQIRSVVAGWCPLIAAAFASKNELSGFTSDTNALKYVLGRAVGFALNRDRQLVELPDSLKDKNDHLKILAAVGEEKFRNESNKVWQDYVASFGLLYDTARQISKGEYCGKTKEHYDVVYGVDGENNDSANNVLHYFVAKKGQPRFLIDRAFVAMFLSLTQSTSNGVFSTSHPSTDLLFEEANWDFARVATQFGKRVSADEIVASLDEKYFTPPHLLYGLGVKNVYSMDLASLLKEKAFENALPQELSKGAEFWRKAIHDENAACVLLNGDSAQGADMIVLSRNRIVMTQYKNTSSMNRAAVQTSVSNMKRRKLLTFLCSIVADPKHADESIEVFYVIAGREANSFTSDAFDGMRTEMPALANDPIKSKYNLRETLHATHAGVSSDYSVPHFYPILQTALPRRSDEQQLGRTMIRSCINGENLETSTVHF